MSRTQARIDHAPTGTFLSAGTSAASPVHRTVRVPIFLKAGLDLREVPVTELTMEVPHDCGVAEQGVGLHHPASAGLLWVLAHVLQINAKAIRIP